MNNKLLMTLLQYAINQILEMCVTKETQQRFVDSMLDAAAKFASQTDNELDDKIVKTLSESIRKNFDIPDLP